MRCPWAAVGAVLDPVRAVLCRKRREPIRSGSAVVIGRMLVTLACISDSIESIP